MRNAEPAHLIALTTYFRVDHCADCMVPGYLIVSALSPVPSFSGLSAPAASELGTVLARSTRAIEATVEPVRVYCARFGEESEAVHFHLLPRTRWLTDQYRRLTQSVVPGINGPLFLNWTRSAYRRPDQPPEVIRAVEECIPKLREAWAAAGEAV